ncbi:NF038120 family PEP-CTERM protein [Massilia niabensis]|uniref:NF038120 family PEP-CTERM protein n=1 Tax=Massilia niabensis TaxID=544910 RepID=A0ABW0LBP9_9BURK
MTRSNNPAVHTNATGVLKKLLCVSMIGALGAVAAPASAAVVTFDAVQNIVSPQLNSGDTVYNTGDAFTEAGFTLRVANSATADAGEVGLVGALVDSSDAFACVITSCPVGNGSTYFAGLNDGVLNVSVNRGAGFRVSALSYAFLAPTAGLPNFSYGQLVLTGTTQSGATISLASAFPGQNAAGSFTFDQFMVDRAFGRTTLTSLSLNACLFDGNGDCSSERSFTQNQAQFAIDNLNLAVIPEPTSIALMLLGLAGLGTVSRRRK